MKKHVQFDRSEIKKGLQGLSREKKVAFATRSAMRVLPLLAVEDALNKEKEPFGLWKRNERSHHLAALFSAYGIGWVISAADAARTANAVNDVARAVGAAADNVMSAVSAVNDINAVNAVNAAVFAAYAAFADDDDDDAAASAAYTAYAACDPANSHNKHFEQLIMADLSFLAICENAWELVLRPLWPQGFPSFYQRCWENFKRDALSLDAGFEIWLEWYEDRVQGRPINLDQLRQWFAIPAEVNAQGVKAANAYWANLVYKRALQPLNRVRAIFIGYGEAGKTSLITALEGRSVVEGQGDMTPGIEIREWPIEGSDIKAHFWDFGGQVMAHATHQFFLRENCLYVVVLNARSEINGTEQAEYWLEHVKTFGKSAPVMLVGNKCDQAPVELEMSYLREKYRNILNFYPLSCTQTQTRHKAKFESFKQDFYEALVKVGTHQMQFTQGQLAVLEELRRYAPGNAFLRHQEFEAICGKHGVDSEGPQNRAWLLDILDKLGIVIHFPQLPYLDDYVLNPRWLTYGVYTLVYAQQSRLTESDVVRILGREKVIDNAGIQLDYPKEKCRFVIDAMQQFKLCYTLPHDRKTLIIPALLSSDFNRKKIPFQKSGALAFEFVFRGFLPRNILPELIVNRHEEIDREIVWQHGVLLKNRNEDAQALVEVDYHQRVLSLWIKGEGRKDYLGILRDEILKILGRLDLDYSEWIGLPVGALVNPETGLFKEEKGPYRQIIAHAKKGVREFISESGQTYDLQSIIGVIIPESELKHITINELNFFGGDMNKKTTTVIAEQGAQVQQFVNANGNTATQNQTTSPEEKPERSLLKNPYLYLGFAAFLYFMTGLWVAYDLQRQGQLGNKTFKEIVLAPIYLLKTDEKK